MPSMQDKNETEDEEMDQDSQDSDKSDEDESESGSGTENEEMSSEMDEEECERKKVGYLEDMSELERQFHELKEHLYKERLHQVEIKLSEVKAGRAAEYLNPLAQLQDDMRVRTQVAGILRELKIQNIKNKFEAEDQAALQNFESEKILLYDTVQQDIQDRIKRLEEDRHSIDISSDLQNESRGQKRKKRSSWSSPERRRKAVQVTGPYVVYMLQDADIIEDWTAIKKALKASEKAEKKKKEVPKPEKHPYNARFEDGKLFYEGLWYSRGHHIIIDNQEEDPVHVTITAINTGEVWVKRNDGTKSKLYIDMLQLGKYTIRHVKY